MVYEVHVLFSGVVIRQGEGVHDPTVVVDNLRWNADLFIMHTLNSGPFRNSQGLPLTQLYSLLTFNLLLVLLLARHFIL